MLFSFILHKSNHFPSKHGKSYELVLAVQTTKIKLYFPNSIFTIFQTCEFLPSTLLSQLSVHHVMWQKKLSAFKFLDYTVLLLMRQKRWKVNSKSAICSSPDVTKETLSFQVLRLYRVIVNEIKRWKVNYRVKNSRHTTKLLHGKCVCSGRKSRWRVSLARAHSFPRSWHF